LLGALLLLLLLLRRWLLLPALVLLLLAALLLRRLLLRRWLLLPALVLLLLLLLIVFVALLLILREGRSSDSKRQGQDGRSDDEFCFHTRFLDLHWLAAACSGASFPWSNGLDWRWLQPIRPATPHGIPRA